MTMSESAASQQHESIILFEEGLVVQKDQLLLRLDETKLTAELADAEARLKLYQSSFARAQQLFHGLRVQGFVVGSQELGQSCGETNDAHLAVGDDEVPAQCFEESVQLGGRAASLCAEIFHGPDGLHGPHYPFPINEGFAGFQDVHRRSIGPVERQRNVLDVLFFEHAASPEALLAADHGEAGSADELFRIEPGDPLQGGADGHDVPVLVNLDKWNSIPADMQNLIIEVFKQEERAVVQRDYTRIEDSRKKLKEAGMIFIEFSPEDTKRYIDLSQSSGWEGLLKRAGEYGPKLREAQTKK